VRECSGRGVETSAYIDHANQDFVSGWALHDRGIARIEVVVGDESVGIADYGSYRLDVARLLPHEENAGQSGFEFWFPRGVWTDFSTKSVSVKVVCYAIGGERFESESWVIPTTGFASRYGEEESSPQRTKGLSPFPLEVTNVLDRELGIASGRSPQWSLERTEESIDALIYLARSASRETRGLFRYLAYLRDLWTTIDFNARHFPARNRTPTVAGKDKQGIATGPEELFVIVHHLATLKSHGVSGNVCEFGCYKGFSTAVLSRACSRLGFTLDAFDSFEGLPASDSELYREGEFKGAIEEVRANVEEFGSPDAVRFHKGFFSETVEVYPAESVACVWMDVDLEVSARDAMRILPRLDVRSCVFSDECEPEDFIAGEVQEETAERNPDRVIEPIMDAFRGNGRDVAGKFIFGHTGCFWDPTRSMGVLMPEHLLKLRDAII
jgi:hypothetical protein